MRWKALRRRPSDPPHASVVALCDCGGTVRWHSLSDSLLTVGSIHRACAPSTRTRAHSYLWMATTVKRERGRGRPRDCSCSPPPPPAGRGVSLHAEPAESEEEELPALVGALMASPGATLVQVEGRATVGAAEPLTNDRATRRARQRHARAAQRRTRTVGAARAASTHESSDDEEASGAQARPAPRSASARRRLRRGRMRCVRRASMPRCGPGTDCSVPKPPAMQLAATHRARRPCARSSRPCQRRTRAAKRAAFVVVGGSWRPFDSQICLGTGHP